MMHKNSLLSKIFRIKKTQLEMVRDSLRFIWLADCAKQSKEDRE